MASELERELLEAADESERNCDWPTCRIGAHASGCSYAILAAKLRARAAHVRRMLEASRTDENSTDRAEDRRSVLLALTGPIPPPEPRCSRCNGSGRRVYGSTATWRGGAGGQTATEDVCDRCWGSGDESNKGPNLRAKRPEPSAEPPCTQASPETRAMLQTLTRKWPPEPSTGEGVACEACSGDGVVQGKHDWGGCTACNGTGRHTDKGTR
jgi:hypothetical protein